LEHLAAAHGVATAYDDWEGRPREVAPEAVVAALAALDVDASSEEAVRRSLAAVEERAWFELAPPVLVVRLGQPAELETVSDSPVTLTVVTEDGRALPVDGAVEVGGRGALLRRRHLLPETGLGYHRVQVRSGSRQVDTALVVAPERAPAPDGRHWGWQVQLYALRSQGSWGIGDYADLRTVAAAAAADGAGALLVNPLHAEVPVLPAQNSPYSPSSRLFRAVLPLRVEQVPEYRDAPPELQAQVDALRPPTDPERVDRDAAWTAKLAALELLWPRHRVGALAAFRTEPLERYATWCALAEVHGADWRLWPVPEPLPDPERVAFWCWLQLLVDEQLEGAGEGLAVGVLHDLAVGVDVAGADAWAFRDVLALETTVGAPPDALAQLGQDWGLPPWRPDRLRERAYEPFRQMVRSVLRHAGGIRIDHVMGLSRLWWVPAGSDASHGTYVSYDADALLGVLALEATRAGAVVVGEDLGTVQPQVRQALDRNGVLGSAVLWFETDDDGFLPPERWRAMTLASVTTHDLPTAAGFLAEEQVRVRDELGQLGVPVEQERASVRRQKAALLAMLTSTGLLERVGGDVPLAMHAALAASPSRVVLAAFGDAVGDLRQPNLPGTVDEYPNWRLPVADGDGRPLGLEELLAHAGVRRLTALLAEGVAQGSRGVR
jgi:4-alpha-glucanotransferase